MGLLKSITSPGISKNTDNRLNTMPFERTIPMSKPILSCMSISATNPEMVVKELEKISGMAFDNASMAASSGGFDSISSMNRWE